MAAGVFIVLNRARTKIGSGVIDLDAGGFKACLVEAAQALTADFAGGSGDARYADLTAECSGTGYTAGGVDMTGESWTRAAGVVKFDADDVTFDTVTLDTDGAKWIVVYQDTATNKDILGFMDLNTGDPDGVFPSAADLVVTWNAGGLFTLDQSND